MPLGDGGPLAVNHLVPVSCLEVTRRLFAHDDAPDELVLGLGVVVPDGHYQRAGPELVLDDVEAEGFVEDWVDGVPLDRSLFHLDDLMVNHQCHLNEGIYNNAGHASTRRNLFKVLFKFIQIYSYRFKFIQISSSLTSARIPTLTYVILGLPIFLVPDRIRLIISAPFSPWSSGTRLGISGQPLCRDAALVKKLTPARFFKVVLWKFRAYDYDIYQSLLKFIRITKFVQIIFDFIQEKLDLKIGQKVALPALLKAIIIQISYNLFIVIQIYQV